MGNFYTNITLKEVPAEDAVAEMRALNRDSYVVQAGADVVVFDRECDQQHPEILAALSEHLATRLSTVGFAVLNHDDDILWFQLYNQSELVAEYANRGGPGTRVWSVVTTLASSKRFLPVWIALHRPYVFQFMRHHRLVNLLGLPEAAVCSGFNYIKRGELPMNCDEAQLQHVRRDA